ncbi:MAG TPA: hypothetical protein VE032_07030 [Actinomycetota bacterium]|nr:hypothetical protein [Actinomycetota bacterium]
MADIKELFDMVTKQTEPDLDSWREQEDRQRKLARNRRIGAFGIAAVIVLLAAIAFVSLRGGRDDGSEPAGTPSAPTGGTIWFSYLDIATGQRTPIGATMTQAQLTEVSPSGESVVFSTCCLSDDAIWVEDLDGSDKRSITPGEMNGYAATWVDDETLLLQGREADSFEVGQLYLADVATGELTQITDLPKMTNRAWVVRSDVSPDGATVLFHLPRGKGEDVTWDLWTMPIGGGEPAILREDAGFATWGSEGSIVFLRSMHDFAGDSIWIMDGDGGNARRLVGGGGPYTWPQVSPDGTTVAYGNAGDVEIVDVASGEVTSLDASGDGPAWYGNDTLIVDD